MRFREWFQMMTLGHPGKYLRLMAWCLFDSIVVSVPYGLMLGAVYFLLAPLAKSEAALPTGALWGLAAGFLAQLIVYFFIRQKTYIDACTGYAGIIKDSRITLGEHCPWAFIPAGTPGIYLPFCCGTTRRWATYLSNCCPRWRLL